MTELNVPPVLKPLAAPFEFVGKTGAAAAAALGAFLTKPEDSPELFRKSEEVLSDAISELVATTEGIGKLPKPVRNLIDNLPKDKSVLQLDTLAYLTPQPLRCGQQLHRQRVCLGYLLVALQRC